MVDYVKATATAAVPLQFQATTAVPLPLQFQATTAVPLPLQFQSVLELEVVTDVMVVWVVGVSAMLAVAMAMAAVIREASNNEASDY